MRCIIFHLSVRSNSSYVEVTKPNVAKNALHLELGHRMFDSILIIGPSIQSLNQLGDVFSGIKKKVIHSVVKMGKHFEQLNNVRNFRK